MTPPSISLTSYCPVKHHTPPKNPKPKENTNLLVRNRIRRLPHQLLNMLNTTHLRVNLLQHLSPLLQTEYHVFLDQCEFDAGREFFELLELGVCLGEQRFLVFLAPEGKECALLVVLEEHLLGDGGFAIRENGDAPLVLVEFVALDFEVEDCSGGGGGLVSVWGGRGLRYGEGGNLLVLCRYTAWIIPHRDIGGWKRSWG
jgi:hypothetical protein